MGYGVFGNCDAKKCTVYVAKGTYDDYWLSDFGYNIVKYSDGSVKKVAVE